MRIGSVRRTAVLALVAAGLTSTTGCIGSMQLSGKLYTWNKGVSSDKWVQEVVFGDARFPEGGLAGGLGGLRVPVSGD